MAALQQTTKWWTQVMMLLGSFLGHFFKHVQELLHISHDGVAGSKPAGHASDASYAAPESFHAGKAYAF